MVSSAANLKQSDNTGGPELSGHERGEDEVYDQEEQQSLPGAGIEINLPNEDGVDDELDRF